jgi:hypothetical protein
LSKFGADELIIMAVGLNFRMTSAVSKETKGNVMPAIWRSQMLLCYCGSSLSGTAGNAIRLVPK